MSDSEDRSVSGQDYSSTTNEEIPSTPLPFSADIPSPDRYSQRLCPPEHVLEDLDTELLKNTFFLGPDMSAITQRDWEDPVMLRLLDSARVEY